MEKIENAPKEVLVDIVKLSQKQGMQGSNGGWKDFLRVFDKQVGVSLSDPARRSTEALIAFLKTFSNEDDLKFFNNVVEKHEIVKHIEKKPDMSPEQELVYKTIGHPQYALSYSFPSHEEGWLVTKRRKTIKATKSNIMVAVDCEMALCEDGTDALVRVCVVDRDLGVKLDELVKPNKRVVDYRTSITGVSAKDLEHVTCSLQDIQQSMRKLLSRGTILVGHSLNNDLQALKIDHTRVIDTAFIFKYWSGSNFRRPSLTDLCKSVLGYDLRKEGDPHDCLEDARAAMKLVLAKINGSADNDSVSLNQNDKHKPDAMKLLCHRVPLSMPGERLPEIIPGEFTLEKTIKKGNGGQYSAIVVFKNKQEADEAFERLAGQQAKDSSGRRQKLVLFKLDSGAGGSMYVRKMVEDGESNVKVASNKREEIPSQLIKKLKTPEPKETVEDGESNVKVASNNKRPSNNDEIPSQPKKLKTNNEIPEEPKETVECSNCDCYLKEIESLKKSLSERDQEITMLHKIIVSQARKQSGL